MATRFYFPLDTPSGVDPGFHANWNYSTEGIRRRLAHVKGSSTVTTGTQVGPWTAGYLALDRQYVSDQMDADISFSTSVTVKGQLRVAEYASNDNVDCIVLAIRIVSSDGGTVRRELLLPAKYVSVLEFIRDNVNWTNRRIADGDALAPSSTYVTVAGDRLVVEIGYTDATGTTPEASGKWGESEADLGENTTDTTGSGWIEFSNTITFLAETITLDKWYREAVMPRLPLTEVVSY